MLNGDAGVYILSPKAADTAAGAGHASHRFLSSTTCHRRRCADRERSGSGLFRPFTPLVFRSVDFIERPDVVSDASSHRGRHLVPA